MTLIPNLLKSISEDLPSNIIQLKENGCLEFDIFSEDSWKYKVWLKEKIPNY